MTVQYTGTTTNIAKAAADHYRDADHWHLLLSLLLLPLLLLLLSTYLVV